MMMRTELACRVERERRVRDEPARRGHVEDPSGGVVLAEVPHGVATDPHRGPEVDLELLPGVFIAHALNNTVHSVPGVVHHDVEAAEVAGRALYESGDGEGRVGGVVFDDEELGGCVLGEEGGEWVGGGGFAGRCGDTFTEREGCLGGGEADPRGGTCDYGRWMVC